MDDVGLFPDPDLVLTMAKDWLKAWHFTLVVEEVPKAKTKAKAAPKEKRSSPQMVAQQIQLLASTFPLWPVSCKQFRYGQSMNPPPRAATLEFAMCRSPPKTKQQGPLMPPPRAAAETMKPPVSKLSTVSMSPSPVIAGESQERSIVGCPKYVLWNFISRGSKPREIAKELAGRSGGFSFRLPSSCGPPHLYLKAYKI